MRSTPGRVGKGEQFVEDAEITFVRHIRDSSRLNARSLRELAEDPTRDSDWLDQRAAEIDKIADLHDQWLKARGVTD